MSHVVDPVESVGGVKRSEPIQNNAPVKGSNDKSDLLFGSNYILLVMKYTNIAMEHQAKIVQLRGELASVVSKIQGDLSTISEFVSKLQSEAHSGQGIYEKDYGDIVSPDSVSGLSPDFYNMYETFSGDQSSFGSDAMDGVSSQYQTLMAGFLSAVKDLYCASSSGSGPTVGDLSTITNPTGGKDFDMMSYYKDIQDSYGDFSDQGCQVVSTNSGDHASLMQQFMYYKAQLAVNTGTTSDVIDANGNIGKLVNFKFGDIDYDSDLGPMMQTLNSFNTVVTVNRGNCPSYLIPQTDSLLSMMMKGEFYNTVDGKTSGWSFSSGMCHVKPGLYAAFSFAAFNYIWTKNPNMSLADGTGNDPGNNWWTNDLGGGIPTADTLSGMYMTTNTAQTNVSASGNQTNTNFQQDVNSVQQVDGAAGKMIDGFSQGQQATIQNFKG